MVLPVCLVGTMQTTDFVESFQNIYVGDDERKNPVDFVSLSHMFKGQGHLWNSMYKTLCGRYGLQF